MKNIVIAALLLFPFSVFANEVTEFNGMKIVLIETETAKKLDEILRSKVSNPKKATMITEIFEAETRSSQGEANFCSTAADYYNNNKLSPEAFHEKCVSILTSEDMIDDLSTGGIDYDSVESLRLDVSKFFLMFFML